MKHLLPIYETLFSWIQQQTGIHITSVNRHPVELALKVLVADSPLSEPEYIIQLMRGELNSQPFIDAITTHESFFLRHKKNMEAAIKHVIQPLLKKGVRPRVLSAPCAQGEEPYSFAMLLQEHGIAPTQVEITAVDIAESSIQQAQQGRYRKYALRQTPDSFIQSHFLQHPKEYAIHPKVRNSVTFIRMNLLTQAHTLLAPGYHLIFSHNLLIYFNQATCKQMTRIFNLLLHDDGFLFVDAVEASQVNTLMRRSEVGGACAFQKGITSDLQQPQKQPVTTPSRWSNPASVRTTTIARSCSEIKRTSAEQAYQGKRFDEAIRLYDQLIDQHPAWACWAHAGKARVLVDSGDDLEALEEAERALSGSLRSNSLYLSNKDRADAHAIIALVLNKKGINAGQKEHLDQVQQLNPKHPTLQLIRQGKQE
ncbi:MAG: hypothetical protein HOL04_04280 [Gammaproteobacteria bacterium]|jgi:chemotaxis methyl-accepting protein methylase|nr:hypothetical protein [Gammaproteobacteria bacterium]MBT4605839.1 hypothetical protein [Thiotrichales bacterium]MBT3489518.1 hypothetical protein [Gammaproteobacteria bacterium]MBT3966770.1 hypothetical protein [Gammaproteobacteria bacterium]MBT4331351.1 hypothetical protein [Gammaproteobacteria bacterium]